MFNRSPLEYEDEIAAIDFVKELDVRRRGSESGWWA